MFYNIECVEEKKTLQADLSLKSRELHFDPWEMY